MRRALIRHPDSLSFAAIHVEVEVAHMSGHRVTLSYVVTGAIADLRLPSATAQARADDLWRHSCFEAFLRPSHGDTYHEFNFAPSTQWAAYRFSGYRSGMQKAEVQPPEIEVHGGPDSYTLRTSLALERLPDLSLRAPWRIGLSALLEDQDGRMAYWALAHGPGKPDFHHPVCFAIELAAAVQS